MGDMDMGDFSPSDLRAALTSHNSQTRCPRGVEAPRPVPPAVCRKTAAVHRSPLTAAASTLGAWASAASHLAGAARTSNYTGDDLDNYSTIWEGEITKTKDADHKRVVTALKKISKGADLASYMDVDNLLRYMAVHIFSVNEDSLSGMMAHNYYLYEYDGQLNIIPWDYNLALGGMSGSNATSVVNEAIDNAFAGTEFFDTLMENETYHGQYYAYMTELVEEYINAAALMRSIPASAARSTRLSRQIPMRSTPMRNISRRRRRCMRLCSSAANPSAANSTARYRRPPQSSPAPARS